MADQRSPTLNCALQIDVILETIFFFLCARDLGNICTVSKKWQTVITRVLKRRSARVASGYSDDTAHDNAISNFAKGQLSIRPRYCLAFLCHGTKRSSNWPLCRPLGLSTREDCEVYEIVGKGCIGTTSNGKVVENEMGVGMACLFIPHGLGDMCLTPIFSESDATQLVSRQQPVRLLVLINRRVEDYSQTVVHLVKAFPNIVVAGGITKEHTSYHNISRHQVNDPSTDVVGFAVSGSSVKVASIVIGHHVKDRENVHDLFMQLRNSGIVDSKNRGGGAFALVFSCYLRGSAQYNGQRNIEADEFMRVFPGIPLTGFFGRGEIGQLHLPTSSLVGDLKCADESEPDPKRIKLQMPSEDYYKNYLDSITRGYSSVYVMVSVVEHRASDDGAANC